MRLNGRRAVGGQVGGVEEDVLERGGEGGKEGGRERGKGRRRETQVMFVLKRRRERCYEGVWPTLCETRVTRGESRSSQEGICPLVTM